eukprot:CAMPEP_0116847324 /NCGR_PEP_ID=MMETSP0418-20121206/14371_1 /TAXON_ID=1158023 /ORGANISM="Astrosyne radiata, Strain 13vi08-1A" /LENGTH=73 /DNA_ID=CAMNT_0004478757 /DNA_START=404 /DNA_END=626 /DNA_ORIENTATION=+
MTGSSIISLVMGHKMCGGGDDDDDDEGVALSTTPSSSPDVSADPQSAPGSPVGLSAVSPDPSCRILPDIPSDS